ncbi:hypothetical protein [Streptomyces sp. NBC_00197]|uniref:hypothetical protein n=1 Tax=Streptomyces sp. NBC_00197 TaxID=2975676 RepID=UPI003244B090
MRFRVYQGTQTPWEIDRQHIRFFVYGTWVQMGGTIEEAGRIVEWILDELNQGPTASAWVGDEYYTFEAV